MFIITFFKDSRKVEINRNYVSKVAKNSYVSKGLFPDIAKLTSFQRKNTDVSRTQKLCHVIHIFFGSFLVTI